MWWTRRAATLPDPARRHAVVVTGSHSMVTDRAAWSERSADWLRAVVAASGRCWDLLRAPVAGPRLGGVVGPGIEMGCARPR
ncbi:MAG: hypothetical protein R2851_07110 [Caldilineaceae bacterium]